MRANPPPLFTMQTRDTCMFLLSPFLLSSSSSPSSSLSLPLFFFATTLLFLTYTLYSLQHPFWLVRGMSNLLPLSLSFTNYLFFFLFFLYFYILYSSFSISLYILYFFYIYISFRILFGAQPPHHGRWPPISSSTPSTWVVPWAQLIDSSLFFYKVISK